MPSHLADDFLVEGVMHLRAVHGNRGDIIFGFVEDGWGGHLSCPFRAKRFYIVTQKHIFASYKENGAKSS